MSDCEDTDDSCGEEQVLPEWEVQTGWLESVFEEFHQKTIQVQEFEVSTRHSSSESVLSAMTRVKGKYVQLESQSEHLFRIIIKRLPNDPFSRFFVTQGQFDLREIKFYTQIMPDLKKFQEKHLKRDNPTESVPLRVPMCYYAHYSPAGGTDSSPVPPESILVLEDLDGPNSLDIKFSEGLTFDQAKAAIDSIACIHAHSLAMKVIEGVPLPERYPFLFQTAKATDSYQQLLERGLPQLAHFLESMPELKTILEALMTLQSKTKDIISALLAPEGPLALITHTDFWCNNLFFENEDDKVICHILDWQMIAYSRPTNDIALLLVSSLPSKLRRNHTESLLDAYWDTLTKTCSLFGLDIPKDLGYTREDLAKDYRRSQLLALLLCIGSVDIALGHPGTEQRLIDVLKDLHEDGILTDEIAIAPNEVDA